MQSFLQSPRVMPTLNLVCMVDQIFMAANHHPSTETKAALKTYNHTVFPHLKLKLSS